MFKKYDPNPKLLNRKKALVVITIIFIVFTLKLLWIAPKFFGYLAAFYLISYIAVRIFHNFTRAFFPDCPKCGELMNLHGKTTVFKGAKNADGGRPFSALAIYKTQCPKCDNFYLQLRYANFVIGDILNDAWVRSPRRSMINFDHLKGDDFLSKVAAKKITKKEYENLLVRLKNKVINNNREAGFPDNPKDIKL